MGPVRCVIGARIAVCKAHATIHYGRKAPKLFARARFLL
jgi:hypothetical protein